MIDQIAKDMLANFQAQAETLKDVKSFTEQQFKNVAESSMKKFDLVTREEFDIQQAILERSREKIEQLESKLTELEQVLASLSENKTGS